jgi:hypothetical protein
VTLRLVRYKVWAMTKSLACGVTTGKSVRLALGEGRAK